MAAYGNRQTPYNFLQYYELYTALPHPLHPKLDAMPRQAVYTLASREGDFDRKESIIKNYNGEPKEELLQLIRNIFPLAETDKRGEDIAAVTISLLRRVSTQVKRARFRPTEKQKAELTDLLNTLLEQING